jgi:uncharacterized protein YegL
MSTRAAFTTDEWRTLQFAPLWIFSAVASVDGKIDNKALEALAKELQEAPLFKEELVRDVLFSVATDLANVMQRYSVDKRDIAAGLNDVADVLDRKAAPLQAHNFKGAMILIGRNIAEATTRRLLGLGDKISENKMAALALIAIVLRATATAPTAPPAPPPSPVRPAPSAPPARPTPPPPQPVVALKRVPICLVVDASRHISDLAFILDLGLHQFTDRVRTQTHRRVSPMLALILADEAGRTTTLVEAARFSSPSLVGRGTCRLGQALSNLLTELAKPAEGKPLVMILLAGPPEDAWTGPADQLRNLAAQGKANVFAIGIEGYEDPAVLKQLTPMQPLALASVTQASALQTFDWLYSVAETMLSGLESGARGQRKSVPAPPACLRVIT